MTEATTKVKEITEASASVGLLLATAVVYFLFKIPYSNELSLRYNGKITDNRQIVWMQKKIWKGLFRSQ